MREIGISRRERLKSRQKRSPSCKQGRCGLRKPTPDSPKEACNYEEGKLVLVIVELRHDMEMSAS
jgi:hypothetical protein